MRNKIFHVHTYRCNHAGEERETAYIEKAVELSAKEIWFTDHAPFPGDKFGFRMRYEQLSEYVSSLQELKKQYEGVIDIKIGLEIEYLPNFQSYYGELRGSEKFDVLLLGQHFSLLPDGDYTFESREKIGEAKPLAEGIIAGMESGYFDVVAHPCQIFRRNKEWTEETERISMEIKECAACTGVSLEQNVSNMLEKRKKRVYRPEFWQNLPDGVRTIYGLDAHSVTELTENYRMQQILIDEKNKNTGR